MTLLCVPLVEATPQAMAAQLARAAAGGAEAVELRLDALIEWDDAGIAALLEAARRFRGQVIATYRHRAEGGLADIDEDLRISRIEQIGLSDAVDAVDVEYAAWSGSANIRQKIGLVCRTGQPSAGQRERHTLILSRHDFQKTPANLPELMAELAAEPAGVLKLACKANTVVDSLAVLDLLHNAQRPSIALAMGEFGMMTRVLAKKLGAWLTFASLEAGRESAPRQVTLADMRGLYRWDTLGPATRVYGVIGSPVAHSMSPALMNAAFEYVGYDGTYLPLLVDPDYEVFARFMDGLVARPWLHAGGCSVTIPHKHNLLRWVGERGGFVEPLAARIGAANTLHIEPSTREDGADCRVSAYNTDYRGALDALCAAIGCTPEGLAGVSVAVIGAGGVTRAIVAGLADCGCKVTIFNRTAEKAEALAAEFGVSASDYEQRGWATAEVIVNGTSIGMWPHTAESPMPVQGLAHRPVVFDTVYNPLETRLLRDARERGCRTADGVSMFVRQAAAQFERWTGRPAPFELMRQVVLSRLSK